MEVATVSNVPEPHDRMAGLAPSINDGMGILVIVAVYWIRIAGESAEFVVLPWYTRVMTDVFLPLLAGLWLWAAALMTLYYRLRPDA